MTTDERRGMPSASGVERLSLCPGSWNLERTLPPLPESEDAASGTRIHRALELSDPIGLSDDELWVYERCRTLRDETLAQVFGDERNLTIVEEWRLWLGGRFSGKVDLVAASDSVLVALDYKSGRVEVMTADGNAQLRAMAVLLDQTHTDPRERIVVGIVQPRVTPAVSLCEYTREDLAKAREWLVAVLDAAEKPDAPRIPGEKQCRWCRAKAVCPEATAKVIQLANDISDVSEPFEVVKALDATTLGHYLERFTFVQDIIEACRDEAKRRLSAGEDVPGWRLKDGAKREVIKDPELVFTRFVAIGGDAGYFMPAVTIAKAKLKEALKKVTGEKGKALDEKLEALLDGLTESKQNAPSLERVKD